MRKIGVPMRAPRDKPPRCKPEQIGNGKYALGPKSASCQGIGAGYAEMIEKLICRRKGLKRFDL